MGERLPHCGNLSGLFPPSFLATWTPLDLRSNTGADQQEEIGERQNYDGRLDEECLRYASLPKSSWIFLFMRHGGRFAALFILPFYFLAEIFIWSEESATTEFVDFAQQEMLPLFAFIFFPITLCWAVGWLAERYFPTVVYKPTQGPKWELNRRKGMVILYRNPGRKHGEKVQVQAPFHEWDGYIQSLPDHQGIFWHRLVLVHKVHEWALPLNRLLAPTTNKPDVRAYWDLVRQYMDITQPLPDMPLFEPYRKLDPTTRQYDLNTGRDPNYWRNMNDQEYDFFQKENFKKLHGHSWQY